MSSEAKGFSNDNADAAHGVASSVVTTCLADRLSANGMRHYWADGDYAMAAGTAVSLPVSDAIRREEGWCPIVDRGLVPLRRWWCASAVVANVPGPSATGIKHHGDEKSPLVQ